MSPLRTPGRLLAAALCLVCPPRPVWADGFIIGKHGKYIPEREQRAFIEWEDGRERLFVATRTDAGAGPALWIVPILAPPAHVRAEPTATFRQVVYTRPAVKDARDKLHVAIALVVTLDTAGVLCPFALGTNASKTFSNVGGVEVHQHLEKLGMVVETLTAQSTEALDRYLAGKQVRARAAELAALEPYLEKEFTLVCGWPASDTQPLEARALQVDFPSPVLFYPLQASRFNDIDIATSIFARGWVKPAATMAIPGLHCRYDFGQIADVGLEELLREKTGEMRLPRKGMRPDEPVTQIELPLVPRLWTQDLILDFGPPAAIPVAQAIESIGILGLWLISTAIGALLLLVLPLALFPKGKRHATDWVWAATTGAALGFSLIAAGVVLCAWLNARIAKGWGTVEETGQKKSRLGVRLFVGAIAAVVWYLTACIIAGRPEVQSAEFHFILLVTVAVFAATVMLLHTVGKKALVLLAFSLLHLALIVGLGVGVDQWLARYE